MPINVKFDRSVITKELRNLERALGKKKINIELNLLGGLTKDQLERIQGRLEALSKTKKVEIPVNIKNGATGKDVDKVVASIKERLAQNQQIKQGGGKLRIETSVKPSITNEDIAVFKKAVKDKLSKIGALEIPTKLDVPKVEDLLKALQKSINRQKPLLAKTSIKPSILSADIKAFKKAVESKLSGITVKINAELETIGGGKTKAQIEKEVLAGLERIQQMGAERMGGGVTEPARRESLRQSLQGRDIGELKDIGKQLGVAGVGKFRNTQNLIERIVTEASIEMITKYLDPQAVMRNPDRSGLNKVLDTFARGLFNMLGMDVASMRQQAAQRRALPGVNFPATVPFRPVSIGPSSTGRALSAGAGPAGMIGAAQAPVGLLPSMSGRSQTQAIVEALIAQQGPRMLPPGGGALVDTKRIYAELQKNLDNALRRMFTVLEVSVFETGAGLKDGLDTFAYLAQALKDAEARTKQSRIAEEVDSLISRIETALRLAAARVNVRQVQIGIGASMQGALPSARVAGLLPAGVGREPSRYVMGGESREQMMARRTAEAYARSALRGVSVMSERQSALPGTTFMGDAFVSGGGRDRVTGSGQPFSRGGAIVPFAPSTKLPENYLAQRDLINSLRGADKFLSQSKIPLSGAIRELGDEFGNAVKQVLLFGTAYKALAFITSIPGQAFEASKALQTFENQLIAITGSAANADRAFGFVESLANRFNVPLDSARQGFVRLYASMAPAGFSSEQIENLFTGITKASATLGLSADKVDRVTYAFSQMASKGQLMSEEVSGQLGDVIPGALSIMAEAARMDIATFKKAMEDGAFVGKAFEQVMSNVPIVLESKFGKGAAGAANTLQGAMNALTTSTTKFYESFEPIVKLGAITVFPVLTETLKQATAAIKAFSSAMEGNEGAANMLTGGARNVYDILLQLKEIFSALAITVKNLAPTFAILGQSILQVLNQVSKFVNTPLGGFIANVVVQAALLTSGLQLLAKLGFGQAIAALINFAFNTKAAVYQMQELIKTSALAKFGLISLGASVVITSIFSVVNALNAVYEKMLDIQRGAKGAAQSIASMSQTEATVKARSIEGQIALLQRFYGQAKKFGDLPVEASAAEVTAMAAAGGTPGQAFTGPLVDQKTGAYGRGTITPTMVPAAIQALEGQLAAARKQAEPVTVQTAELGDVEIEAGKEKNEKKKKLVSELAKIYKQELDNYLVYIDMDTNISDRQKELQKAAISWQYEHAIAKEEYNEKIKEQNTKDIANLAEYLAEQKRLFKLEQDQIDARYQAIVTKPLREMLGEDRKAQIQLQASIASLASGKEEMTRVEQRESEIKQALLGLNDKQKEALAPLIKLVLSEARAVDELTTKQKEQNDAIRERQELQKRVKDTLSNLRNEIELLRGITEEEQKRLKIAQEFKGASNEELNRIYDLEKVRDNIKAVRETIDSFVTDTSSDYKGFLKEVISGEDAVESLKKFQEGLKDRVLTIFLDFAMAPVEKFFKEGLSQFAIENFFPKGAAENMPEGTKPSTTPVEAQDKNTEETRLNTEAVKANTAALTGTGGAAPAPGQTTAAGTSGGFLTGTAALQTLPFNGQTGGMLQNLPFTSGDTGFLSAIGINGEGLSASISESANAYSEQLSKVDNSVFESANALGTAGTELGKEGAAGKKWHESLGQAVGGLGMAAGAVMGIVAGINQIKEGGTSNVLGGIGMIASMAGSLLGSFGGLFGGGGGASSIVQGTDIPIAQMPAGMQFANGGVAFGGFRAFANGGTVSGPTLGLVGEGKYNEAIVPLPDGRSIPVQLGGRSARDLMGNGAPGMPQAPSLSMKFETTKINGVEYVSREQLEQAMAETRRASIAGGAQRGMSMTLDKIKQSPSTRSSIGIR
jgi:tape measure domain-containing protein